MQRADVAKLKRSKRDWKSKSIKWYQNVILYFKINNPEWRYNIQEMKKTLSNIKEKLLETEGENWQCHNYSKSLKHKFQSLTHRKDKNFKWYGKLH